FVWVAGFQDDAPRVLCCRVPKQVEPPISASAFLLIMLQEGTLPALTRGGSWERWMKGAPSMPPDGSAGVSQVESWLSSSLARRQALQAPQASVSSSMEWEPQPPPPVRISQGEK
ncbi:hypothetical protein LEMLEM_LOCUS6328, partial [Lemmus lemmus]